MKVASITVASLTVFAMASCGGSDNSTTNNNNNNNTQYALTLSSGQNGTLAASPSTLVYDPGTVVTLTATPSPGFKVASWTGTDADASTSPTNHVTMNADESVSVTFAAVSAQTFNLTITQNANGTVAATPTGPTYNDGTTVTLTATPNDGFTVDTWSGTDDDTSTALTNHVTMTANKTVSATFKAQAPQKSLVLTISEDGIAGTWGVTVSAAGVTTTTYHATSQTLSFDQGATVTLTGVSAPSWPFTGWSGTDAPVGHEHDCTITLTMDVDRAITANIPDDPGGTMTNDCP